jgi:hypothetical protein
VLSLTSETEVSKTKNPLFPNASRAKQYVFHSKTPFKGPLVVQCEMICLFSKKEAGKIAQVNFENLLSHRDKLALENGVEVEL